MMVAVRKGQYVIFQLWSSINTKYPNRCLNSLRLYLQGIFRKQQSQQRTGAYFCTANYPVGGRTQCGCLFHLNKHVLKCPLWDVVKTSTEGGKLYAADGCLLTLFIENKSSNDGTAPEPSPSFTFGCLMACRSVLFVFVSPRPLSLRTQPDTRLFDQPRC